MISTDIDIDVADREYVIELLKAIPARGTDGKKHLTGMYLNPIPYSQIDGIANIPYKEAATLGYFKIDVLNVSFYDKIRSNQDIYRLIEKEPMWVLLEHKDFVEQLLHVNQHYDLVSRLKPRTVEQLAAVLAIIRPGKRHLEFSNWDTIMNEVWVDPKNGSYFYKKSHAISYALLVVAQMNYICEEITSS